MDLAGSAAIVTGGASGLGGATARRLAAAGASVVVLDRDAEKGDALASEIGGRFVRADVSDEAQVMAAIDTASELGPLRVLVNCAGIGPASRIVGRGNNPIEQRKFDFVIRVNLIGTYNCSRLAAAAIADTEPLADGTSRGAILHTASVAAFDGQIGQTAYAAAKAGVCGMTLPMARDLARYGIRVNTIAPGVFDTPIYDAHPSPDEFKAGLGANVVFPNRAGVPDEFARLALETLTNDYLNGEVIRLDRAIRMPPR